VGEEWKSRGDPAPRSIAFAGGCTAGHLSPALAVAAAYRALRPGARVLFIGSAPAFAERMVEAHGHRLVSIPAAPFYRVAASARLSAVSQLIAGVCRARPILVRERVQMVIGFGSYASAGAILAARSLGLATAVHECNAEPGLANRLLSRVVDRVYLGDLTRRAPFAARRMRATGTPVRPEVIAAADAARTPPRTGRARLLVCGGSEGSPFLNRRAPELARAISDRGFSIEVRHQSGDCDRGEVAARYAALGVEGAVAAYIDDIADAYAWADLAITTAGAATLAELAVCGLPALLVPLGGAAADHQSANAAAFAAATGNPWVREPEWRADELAARLTAFLADVKAWSVVGQRSRTFARRDAAEAVVADCEELLALRS
jgi:UDP-N-acetylglucosamine--N-acetylmuramyl-(pentapeptide) pyrophosphoryl-undecaprenol N-acetylglucosamine transferase